MITTFDKLNIGEHFHLVWGNDNDYSIGTIIREKIDENHFRTINRKMLRVIYKFSKVDKVNEMETK